MGSRSENPPHTSTDSKELAEKICMRSDQQSDMRDVKLHDISCELVRIISQALCLVHYVRRFGAVRVPGDIYKLHIYDQSQPR